MTPDPDGRDVAHFSHPVEADLFYNINRLDGEGGEAVPRWPQLLLEILSIDWWGRARVEVKNYLCLFVYLPACQGYGHTALPTEPGCHQLRVETWRPVRDRRTEMRRFLVGGPEQLEEIRYCGADTADGAPGLESRLELTQLFLAKCFLRLNSSDSGSGLSPREA